MITFINEIGASSFLFDDTLVEYLKEIEKRVYRANGLNEIMDNLEEHQKERASNELQEHISWLSEQSGVITDKFRRSLELR